MTTQSPPRERDLRIDVVLPVYNKLRFLRDAVGSVVEAAGVHGYTQVWLVDNGSTDGSYELLVEQFGNRARVLRLMTGTIAAVRNIGANHGSAPIISFIDCDCVVPNDYFTRLEAVFEETNADATGCAVVLPPKPTWTEAVWNRMHDDGANGTRAWINSANFAVRRSIFEQIGGFNEACETDEDTEICHRLRRAGGRLVSDRRLAAAHLDNAKTVTAFFRKERWRGLGMFSTSSVGSIDKPTAMLFAHILAIAAAIAIVVFAPIPLWTGGLVAVVSALLVPVTTVLYRRRSSIAQFSFGRAVLLYEVFYLARLNALAIIAVRAIRAQKQLDGHS